MWASGLNMLLAHQALLPLTSTTHIKYLYPEAERESWQLYTTVCPEHSNLPADSLSRLLHFSPSFFDSFSADMIVFLWLAQQKEEMVQLNFCFEVTRFALINCICFIFRITHILLHAGS